MDQAGFRSGFSTEDHIFTIVNLIEKTAEYNLPIWIAAIDYEKAFDTVEHDSLWEALSRAGVGPIYIRTLAALYAGQTGVVVDELQSRSFNIKRGTKQGDPLSPSIFNAVLEQAFDEVLPRWHKRKYGFDVGYSSGHERLTNLRFADDVLLIASSKRQLTRMMHELMEACGRVGLVMHPDKTKILTNCSDCGQLRSDSVVVNGAKVDILRDGQSTMYLGWALGMEATQDTELRNRINKGWAKFMMWKKELCCKRYSLQSRLKLFNAVIMPSILYACGTWTMSAYSEMQLRTTQRKMMRSILGSGRKRRQEAKPASSSSVHSDKDKSDKCDSDIDTAKEKHTSDGVEPWMEWIQRVTGIAEHEARKAKVPDWVEEQRRRKWRWAGHLMRRSDGRWSTKILQWAPVTGQRSVGHPARRWADCIDQGEKNPITSKDFFQKPKPQIRTRTLLHKRRGFRDDICWHTKISLPYFGGVRRENTRPDKLVFVAPRWS